MLLPLSQGADFHRDLHGLAEQVVPQHHLRLDAQSLSNVHFGEASCRDFRDSVLRALPHRCCALLCSDISMQALLCSAFPVTVSGPDMDAVSFSLHIIYLQSSFRGMGVQHSLQPGCSCKGKLKVAFRRSGHHCMVSHMHTAYCRN